ncbi:MAG TPA: hypothetical protein VF850_12900 [Gemmatimonadaceae bacterium]
MAVTVAGWGVEQPFASAATKVRREAVVQGASGMTRTGSLPVASALAVDIS